MQRTWGLFCCVCLCFSAAAADLTQLRQLEVKDRIFELRRTLQQPGGSEAEALFFRGVTAARFGNEAAAIEDLRKFLTSGADPKMRRKVYEELASARARTGHYGQAAQAWTEALRLTPEGDGDRADNEETRALYEALRSTPPQTVSLGVDARTEATRNGLVPGMYLLK